MGTILTWKNGKFRNELNSISDGSYGALGFKIHSVKRLSDGEYKVDDDILVSHCRSDKLDKIKSFYIESNTMWVRTEITKKPKESTKTAPVGVRFDKDMLELVKSREKLPTNQKVVDFLLNKYWWEHKVEQPSIKGLPPQAQIKPIESKKMTKEEIEALLPEGERMGEYVGAKSTFNTVRPFDKYALKKANCASEEDWQPIWEEIKDDKSLSPKQKEYLRTGNFSHLLP